MAAGERQSFCFLTLARPFSFDPNKSGEKGQRWQDYSPTTPSLPQCLPNKYMLSVFQIVACTFSFLYKFFTNQIPKVFIFRAQKTVFILLLTPSCNIIESDIKTLDIFHSTTPIFSHLPRTIHPLDNPAPAAAPFSNCCALHWSGASDSRHPGRGCSRGCIPNDRRSRSRSGRSCHRRGACKWNYHGRTGSGSRV